MSAPSFPSSVPMIHTLFLWECPFRDSHFSSRVFTKEIDQTYVSHLSQVLPGHYQSVCSSLYPDYSSIGLACWEVNSTLSEVVTSIIRASTVAHISCLRALISTFKDAVASRNILLFSVVEVEQGDVVSCSYSLVTALVVGILAQFLFLPCQNNVSNYYLLTWDE